MKIKFLIILILILILLGCVSSPIKNNKNLIPLTNKIYLEVHDENNRSYHMKMDFNFEVNSIIFQIYNLNGVQSVQIIPYQIDIRKSPLFKWDDIEKNILIILK